MAEGLPIVDPRRASKLRETLLRNAQMLAPDWTGHAQDGDFGRALLKIAARLAEHGTSRLDGTPLRDKLAFLDALDVATPAPQPATVPIVFTLAEKRDAKVAAPARVQLTAEIGEAEFTFETRAAIDLTPARIGSVVMADPSTDRIERAPPYVTRSVDTLTPPTRYLLLSAVEANARSIQLVQAVGIQPDDLLRLSSGVYRVEKVKGGIVQLRDELAQPAPAGATVEKLIALESFALRNLQDHAVYFGHKEMLKLEGTAAITLVFDPPSLPAQLAALDLEYALYGTRDEDEGPGWQELELQGAGPGGLVLGKTWAGKVDEFELPAGKSRWVRVRLRTPIAGACGPSTGAASVELKVRSTKPSKGAGSEGSETISGAFYNSQPLRTTTAFLPFGPEPQRFDVFSFSAPEALSKKGAKVTLDFTFDDASLGALAYDPVAPDHVYGVSVNGRLQSIRISPSGDAEWRPLGLAPAEGGATGGSVRLDADASPYVLHAAPSLDLVFVRGEDGMLRVAKVTTAGENWTVSEWMSLPHPNGGTFSALCLVPDSARLPRPAGGSSLALLAAPPGPSAFLIGAGVDGLYAQEVGGGGSLAGNWKKLASGKDVGTIAALAVAKPAFDFAMIAGVNSEGAAFDGVADLANSAIAWTELDLQGAKASSKVRPVAFPDDGALVMVAASDAQDPGNRTLIVTGGAPPVQGAVARVGAPQSIALLPAEDDDADPLVVVTGDKGILIWAGDVTESAALPATSDPGALRALLLPGMASPRLLLGAASERVLVGEISTGRAQVLVELRDRLRRDHGSPIASHALIKTASAAAIHELHQDWIDDGTNLVQPAPHNEGKSFVLLESVAGNLRGKRLSDRSLELDTADAQTGEDDVLEIGGEIFIVSAPPAANVVEVDAELPTGPDLTYALYRPTKGQEISLVKADRKRFAKLDSQPSAPPLKLVFASPAAPKNQDIVDQHDAWLLLKKPWTTVPAASNAQASLISPPGIRITRQIPLPREADNPELSWEYFDGEGWQRLDRWGLTDRTGNFARTGTVSFTVPATLSQTEVAGKEDYWLRARLIGGDYGRPAYDIVTEPPIPASQTTTSSSKTSISIDRSRLNPPEIISIEASYVLDEAVPPDRVVADNNLAAIDQSQAALAEGAVFNLFEGVAQHVGDAGGGTRALYLGLSKRPDVQALGLYADVLDRDEDRRQLVAEVLTAGGWRRVGVDDGTAGLVRPGLIQLHLLPPPEQLPLFGQDGWWLRLRPKEAAEEWTPVVRGLFVNAVIAAHAKTVTGELLGSSLGEPNQRYLLAHNPVLPDTLELRVLESLGEEERHAVEAALGQGAIAEDAEQRGQWVRWRQVETFVDEDGDARIFRLDPASGEVLFGNGACGKIPPAGRDSIRAFNYQWGGGSGGNVPARAIANLSSALESVELAMNPVDAAGGADAPAADRLAVTAPNLLRHAGRALTPSDIEAIATGSAPDVVRARCLPRRGCSIELAVAIRDTGQRCPVPSRERREGIARNIFAAGWGALAPDAVTVRGPRYVAARVEAEVIALSAEAVAGVERDIRHRLAQFLHPVEGGPDRLGWPFGRRIWPSDLQRAIAGIAGLDSIVALAIGAKAAGESLAAMPLDGLICVEDADLAVIVRSPEAGR